jgi:hypothetical protein
MLFPLLGIPGEFAKLLSLIKEPLDQKIGLRRYANGDLWSECTSLYRRGRHYAVPQDWTLFDVEKRVTTENVSGLCWPEPAKSNSNFLLTSSAISGLGNMQGQQV